MRRGRALRVTTEGAKGSNGVWKLAAARRADSWELVGGKHELELSFACIRPSPSIRPSVPFSHKKEVKNSGISIKKNAHNISLY
jgi:hypothetical protein